MHCDGKMFSRNKISQQNTNCKNERLKYIGPIFQKLSLQENFSLLKKHSHSHKNIVFYDQNFLTVKNMSFLTEIFENPKISFS